MRLSTEERRALGIILGLLILAAGGRWLERPRSLLEDVPALDLAALEDRSRDAKPAARGAAGSRPGARAEERAGSGGRGGAGAGAAAADGRLDPNTASVAELQRLPGVGAAMAQRIVEERESGVFASAADLQRVRGIGPALAAKLAEHVTLPAEAAAMPAVARDPPTRQPAAAARSTPGAAGGGATGRPAAPIDLNRAPAAELQAVPGIGPALAARLVARRDSLGGFRDWAQVDATRGIGPAVLARLQQLAVLRP